MYIAYCLKEALRPSYKNAIRYVQMLGGWFFCDGCFYGGYKLRESVYDRRVSIF